MPRFWQGRIIFATQIFEKFVLCFNFLAELKLLTIRSYTSSPDTLGCDLVSLERGIFENILEREFSWLRIFLADGKGTPFYGFRGYEIL